MSVGPIIRSWTATVRRDDVADWIATFRERVFPHMRAIDGFLGVNILQAIKGDPARVTVLTRWRDMTALRAFAGEHPEIAVIPDFMRPFFVDHDATATFHTDIFQEAPA